MGSSSPPPTDRISIVTDEIAQDLAVVRTFLDEHRVSAVELRTVSGRRVPELSSRDLETLDAWAGAGDPVVVAVSPGLFKCDLEDSETARRHLDETLPLSIELALRLGAGSIVAFSFENLSRRAVGTGPAEDLAEAAEACRAAGLELLVENEPGFVACTGEETAALVRAAGHESLRVNWDPANAGDLDADALAAGLRAVYPFVRHVHVKNGRVRPGERFPSYGPLRGGDIDWPAQLGLLHELGYEGRYGIETHFEPLLEGSAIVLAELREMLADLPARESAS